MGESEHTLTYIVKVTGFGSIEKLRPTIDKALGRALHKAFPGRFEYIREGKSLIYDPFGHDDEPLEAKLLGVTDLPDATPKLKPVHASSEDALGWVCPICSAVVDEPQEHDAWHNKLNDALIRVR